MQPAHATVLRALAPADLAVLSAELPALLPGNWSVAALQELAASRHRLRVLELRDENGTVVAGFAEYRQIVDEAHLYGIAILRPWQGRGLGRELLDNLLHEMQGLGCVRCLLEVREGNRAARHLYERAGFGLDGRRQAYYPPDRTGGAPEDALLYSLPLPLPLPPPRQA